MVYYFEWFIILDSIYYLHFMLIKSIDSLDFSKQNYDKFYDYYIYTLKNYREEYKKKLLNHTCIEINTEKLSDKNSKKYDLYTILMQNIGNNLRASGDSFDSNLKGYNQTLMKRIESIIDYIIKYNANNNDRTRICVDAIQSILGSFS